MSKRVLDVGQCGFDHSSIRQFIEECIAGAEVLRAHGLSDALRKLQGGDVSLILVNRRLDRDGSDGIEVIRRIKADPAAVGAAVMLVSDYSKYQEQAVAAGALPGFGKSQLRGAGTLEKIRAALGESG